MVWQDGQASKTLSTPDSTGVASSNVSADSGMEEDSFAIMVGRSQNNDCGTNYQLSGIPQCKSRNE